jgi:hypothetical protein
VRLRVDRDLAENREPVTRGNRVAENVETRATEDRRVVEELDREDAVTRARAR